MHMSTPNERVGVVAAVIDKDGRVLIAKRPSNKRYGSKWEFPGGKCEPGESHHQAIRRELHEELGLTVVASQLPQFAVADRELALTIYYIPTTVVGTAQPHEHEQLAWVTDGELLTYDLAPSDRSYAEFRYPTVVVDWSASRSDAVPRATNALSCWQT